MADIFEKDVVSKIDMRKTVANGKNVFLLYQPLVEKRLKQLKKIPMNSASLVIYGGKSGGKSSDDKLINRLSWENDQIANFIKNIMDIKEKDSVIGEFLRLKCFYGMTDDEISKRIKVSIRSVAYYKSKAYYYLAVYSNQVEFIEEKTYYFYLD